MPAQHVIAVRDRLQTKVAKGDALHLLVGGMFDDALRVLANAIAVLKLGRMLVCDERQIIQPPARQRTHAPKVGLQVREQIVGQVEPEQRSKLRISIVEIGAPAVRNGMPMRRWRGGRAHRNRRGCRSRRHRHLRPLHR
ncbi:hypothetical protein SDC9_157833 [bioreactor metagenome]|uniref:Uncharacterized protein n=1 Tax=bioreactor metagenome TaxID=1076179 RepID=A0A645F857_9ZZZZ